MTPNADVHAMGRRALAEVGGVLDAVSGGDVEAMCSEIRAARRIACYGVGREGLMMKALCMRLMHLGLDAHVVGDMTTPPVGEGDLLLVSAGPGWLLDRRCAPRCRRDADARTLVVTAQPDGAVPRGADVVVELPAQTMADDRGGELRACSRWEASTRPLSSCSSTSSRSCCATASGQAPDAMRERHTNLE